MKQINCNKCEKDFDIEVKIETIINDVKRVFSFVRIVTTNILYII